VEDSLAEHGRENKNQDTTRMKVMRKFRNIPALI